MDLLVSPKLDHLLPPLLHLLVQDSGDMETGPPGGGHVTPEASRNVLWVIEGTSCDLPWQAALFKGEKFLCGGTLVDKNWVLTAAHCHVPGFISVRLGGQSHKDSGGIEQWRRSAKVFKYPRYNDTNKDGDLMLIKFLLPIHVTKHVKPLPLASRCPVPGKTCQISGWGSTTSPEASRNVLWVIEGTSCDLPWQAALFKGEKFLCGGTLVDKNWVLTAAHCHVPG
ncbi:PREDICTED: kallikrein-8-like [Nipponia nippon]|uniref:kallikrein-8-like n=1 Tax=Nipponia nippon TaxID=128390 RepID=UPI000511653B|nr:PREDICTED: kallikrein-8-like [Nipponia nippon]